jgi:hypothetical protein
VGSETLVEGSLHLAMAGVGGALVGLGGGGTGTMCLGGAIGGVFGGPTPVSKMGSIGPSSGSGP